MPKKLDKYEFIWKAIQKHGYKYDYRKVNYKNNSTKVCIICPEHGEFWQTPNSHLNGCGCSKCYDNNRSKILSSTLEEFIEKAKVIHGDKYGYSKVEYKGSFEKVCIICPKHGEFWMKPGMHLFGQGCPKCGLLKRTLKRTRHVNEFIEKSKEIHGDKYDYSKVIYKGNKIKVCIICPEHGEFWQRPNDHLSRYGCPMCNGTHLYSTEEFIEKAKQVHGDRYDYSKVEYTNSKTKICIICPIHGKFYQMPYSHLQGFGCPICRESKMEKEISNVLKHNQIRHIRQYRPLFLMNKRSFQSLDFYLPDYDIAIECQGIQHFEPVDYFGGVKSFEKTQERDKRKLKLCSENNIKLLYYTKPELKTANELTNEQELLTFLKNIKNERTRNFSNNDGY